MTKLCKGGIVKLLTKTPEEYDEDDYLLGLRPSGVKRMRLKCPICGRKLLSSVYFDIDASNVIHTIPPHKPKGWWKLNKRRKIRR